MKKMLLTVFLCLALVTASQAVIREIEIITEQGLSSVHDAPTMMRTIEDVNNFAAVKVVTDAGDFNFTRTDTLFNFHIDQDNSDGFGNAACYTQNPGVWSIKIMDSSMATVLELGGTLSWYLEEENPAQALYGRGIVNLTTVNVSGAAFGTQAQWGSPDGKSIFYVNTTSLNANPLNDYQQSFTGRSKLTVYAEVPEPLTLLLLGGGALGWLRQRRIVR